MKMKSLILLAMAIGCGFVAMLGVRQVLSSENKPVEETAKVLVALTSIMPGQPLDDTNVAFKDWPKQTIPQGAVTSHEQYVERSLRVGAVPNEPIMAAKLNDKGVFGGSSEIPSGMRVATVPVTMTKTHSGLILPGDRVDVVVTYTMHHVTAGQMNSQVGEIRKAKTILQYLEVFATDNIRLSGSPNGDNKEVSAKNISLLVTPDQYNLLMFAETKGQISLALRNRGDSADVHPRDVDETSFEQTSITRGNDNKKDEDSQADGENSDKTKGVGDALDKEAKAAAATKDGKPGKEEKEAVKPSWKLKVYEGDKLREEQVELPAEPDQTGKGPVKAGGKLQEFLKSFFRSAS
jgi:pilus assembly protein CpaB